MDLVGDGVLRCRPNHHPDDLHGARRDVGLTQDELWMRYFALGGAAMPIEFEAYLARALDPGPLERDILVHAITSARWSWASSVGGLRGQVVTLR